MPIAVRFWAVRWQAALNDRYVKDGPTFAKRLNDALAPQLSKLCKAELWTALPPLNEAMPQPNWLLNVCGSEALQSATAWRVLT